MAGILKQFSFCLFWLLGVVCFGWDLCFDLLKFNGSTNPWKKIIYSSTFAEANLMYSQAGRIINNAEIIQRIHSVTYSREIGEGGGFFYNSVLKILWIFFSNWCQKTFKDQLNRHCISKIEYKIIAIASLN